MEQNTQIKHTITELFIPNEESAKQIAKSNLPYRTDRFINAKTLPFILEGTKQNDRDTRYKTGGPLNRQSVAHAEAGVPTGDRSSPSRPKIAEPSTPRKHTIFTSQHTRPTSWSAASAWQIAPLSRLDLIGLDTVHVDKEAACCWS